MANNSYFAIDQALLSEESLIDTAPIKEREGELLTIIDALQGIQSTKEWSTLKEKVFDDLSETLEKAISAEAKKEEPDTLKLNRLTGQLKWAEKYADLTKLVNVFRAELANIRRHNHGKI